MIIIIGAGISGLTLAYELQKLNIAFLLIEGSSTTGGYIKSVVKEGYLLELGPNSLLADNELLSFIEELGLINDISYSNDVSKSRYIFKKGKYRELPTDPLRILLSSFFTLRTKFEIIKEFFKPVQNIENETLAHFFHRRFSDEIVQYALDPFVSGIYAGDVSKLSLEATFPNLKKYENDYGSVLKGLIKNSKGVARKKSLNFSKGMQMLPLAIQQKLDPKNLLLNTEVKRIERIGEHWEIETQYKTRFEATKVVFCGPSFQLTALLNSNHIIDKIAKIKYAPMAAVHTVYKKTAVKHHLNGFGGLNPSIENQFSLGSIWTSSVFNKRCAADEVLFTTFVGGDKQKHKLIENEPWQIMLKVHQELSKNFDIDVEKPEFQHFYRWEKALPQYENSIFDAWKEAKDLEKDNLIICSNWKDGVSLSDCIKKAKLLSKNLSH